MTSSQRSQEAFTEKGVWEHFYCGEGDPISALIRFAIEGLKTTNHQVKTKSDQVKTAFWGFVGLEYSAATVFAGRVPETNKLFAASHANKILDAKELYLTDTHSIHRSAPLTVRTSANLIAISPLISKAQR